MNGSAPRAAPPPIRHWTNRQHRIAGAFFVLSVAVLCAGSALIATRATAVYSEITRTGNPGMLALWRADATPLWRSLGPGDTMHWLIQARLSDAPTGSLDLELRANGALVDPHGMTATISACSQSFDLVPVGDSVVPQCAGNTTTVLAPTPLTEVTDTDTAGDTTDGTIIPLPTLRAEAPRELLVSLQVPASARASTLAGATASIGLGLHAAGDSMESLPPVASPAAPLALSGADALPLLALALGLVGTGISLGLLRRSAPTTTSADGG